MAIKPAGRRPKLNRGEYLAIWESVSEGVVVQDQHGHIIAWNGAAEQILGLSGEEISHRSSRDPRWRSTRENGDDFPADEHPAMITLRTGEPQRQVLMLLESPSLAKRWIRINSEPVAVGPDGLPRCVVSTFADVTEERLALQSLRAARDQADAANAAKSRFLANMSHEIRTPMNGVLGLAQALARTPLNPTQQRMVEVILQAGDGLLAILGDVLDFSRIEAGHLALDLHPFRLDEIGDRILALHGPMAADKGVDLQVTWRDPGAPSRLGDLHRVLQILHNLVFNALKFTEQGKVWVRLEAEASDPDAVCVEVVDTGAGMSPETLARAFESFARFGSASGPVKAGSGLGLAITRELVEIMGGTIALESPPGEGVHARVRLPLARVVEPAVSQPSEFSAPITFEGLNLLVAEDEPVNRLVLQTLLEPLGVQLTFAHDGVEAVETFAVGGFDLVLMDICMPRQDGKQALQVIRRRFDPGGATPAIALTANAIDHQVAELLSIGFDAHVEKPIQLPVLLDAIADVLEAARPRIGPALGPTIQRPS